MLRINYTYLNRVWITLQNGRTVKETYVMPFGMVKIMSSILSHKKCYNTFDVLPEQVKSELNFTEETLSKEFVSLDVSHKGSKGYVKATLNSSCFTKTLRDTKYNKIQNLLITILSFHVHERNIVKFYVLN